MNRSTLLLATIAVTFVAGCASTPVVSTAADAQDDKTRVTGSRLPARDPSSPVKWNDNKQGIGDMMQRGSGTVMPSKGGAM
jgi:outer membrane lipoprotein SlyB